MVPSGQPGAEAISGSGRDPAPPPWRVHLYRLVPAFDSLRNYSWNVLRLDVVAGLTVAAVAVPQAMAYATIAGMHPEIGLYTAIVMTAVGALFDSSRQLINGPTNAISIAVFSALVHIAPERQLEAVILLSLLIGVVQVGITLMRLGDLTRYISHAVIVGFTVGAAVLIVLDQMKNLLGLPAQGEAHQHFLVRFGLTMGAVADTHLPTLAVGLATLGIVLALRGLNARLGILIPEFLTALVLMGTLAWFLDLEGGGVRVVGAIPAALPSFELPRVSSNLVRELAGSALAIALLGLLEAIAMAKAIAARTRQKLDINQQCLSEGLANLAGSLFRCMPGSGSLTRSNINVQAGAVSQWSGVFSAIFVAGVVLLLAPLARFLPRASLAAILFLSAWRLVDRAALRHHLRSTRFDAAIVAATALSAVLISVEFCILIGVFLSFVLFVPRAARVHLTEFVLTPDRVLRERNPEDPPCSRLFLAGLEGELFFGSAPELEKHFEGIEARAAAGVRVVVLRLKRARNPDGVCLDLLRRLIEDLQSRRVHLLLCGVRPDVEKPLLSSGLVALLGEHNLFREVAGGETTSTLEAVRRAYEILGPDLCDRCPRREKRPEPVLYYMI